MSLKQRLFFRVMGALRDSVYSLRTELDSRKLDLPAGNETRDGLEAGRSVRQVAGMTRPCGTQTKVAGVGGQGG